jgi:O-antigen biosynthesis protein
MILQEDEAQVCLKQAQEYWQSQQWQETIQTCAKALALDQQLASAHKLMGDALQKNNQAKEAIGYYHQAIAIEPDYAEVYANLGSLYAQQQNWQQAIQSYQQALKIKPNFTAVYRHLARCQQLQQAQTSAESNQNAANYLHQGKILQQQGNAQAALEHYLQAAAIEPQNVATYREIIKLCEQLENWAEAAKYCRLILDLSNGRPQREVSLAKATTKAPTATTPENSTPKLSQTPQNLSEKRLQQQKEIALQPTAEAHVALARTLEESGNQEQATEIWLKAIALNPAALNATEYLALGKNLLLTNQQQKAISCYRQAIKQQPDLIDAYLALGELLAASGANDQALSCYLQGLKLKQDPQLYFRLGNLYQGQQQWTQAALCYQKATQYDPKHAAAHHELGEVFSHLEEWAKAIAAYGEAIKYNPDFSWTHNNLGYALVQLKRWSAAIPVYEQAIKLNPSFPWSHYNLAEAQRELKQWSGAIEHYHQAALLQADLPQVQQKLGDALYRRSQEDRQQALEHFLLAIEQDPGSTAAYHQALAIDKYNIELYLKLGDILNQSGKSEQALAIYQMALQIQPKHGEILARLEQLGQLVAEPSVELNPGKLADRSIATQANFQELARELQQILPHSETPEVSIIIPVYNQLDYTLKCLKAIALNLAQNTQVEIILVNDCSTDQTKEILEPVTAIALINQQSNQGFIHSCNQGASLAKGKYLYFLNNDTEIKANCIESLVSVLAADEQVGAVGSKLIYPQGSLQEAGCVVWSDASGWNYGRQDNPLNPKYNYLRPVDYCSGASLMVRREVFETLAGFEWDFVPAYYEDTDLCFAIRHLLKLKVMYQPKSEVIHYEGISSGVSTTSGTKKYQLTNAVKFKQKWQAILQKDYLLNRGITNVPLATRKYLGKKTILVIDSYMPSYDRESGSKRLFELLKIFKSLDFHVIFAADNGVKEEPYVDQLQNLQIETLYTEKGYGVLIEQQIQERLPLIDLAWICRPELNEKYMSLIRQRPEIKIVYDTIDLHYLRLKRAWELSPEKAPEMATEWIEMQSQELKIAHQADLTITVTTVEQQILTSQAVDQVAVVPNVHSSYQGDIPSFSERSGILFIGSYNHPPNIDAVLWLCHEIMPLVWETDPDITVTLLGNNPNAEVLALASDRITVTGYINDVSPYFLNHKLSVSPLRYGAGMKGKIGQSLEYRLPVVSTSIGTEGMNLIPEQHILEANNTLKFAAKILDLYHDENIWHQLFNCAGSALSPYTFDSIKKTISTIVNQLLY